MLVWISIYFNRVTVYEHIHLISVNILTIQFDFLSYDWTPASEATMNHILVRTKEKRIFICPGKF